MVFVDWQEYRRWRERKEPTSKAIHWFTWVIVVTGMLQGGLFTGKSAGCPAFLPVGKGGEESRPCNHNYISRKPRPVGGELHIQNVKSIMVNGSLYSIAKGHMLKYGKGKETTP
jgi:hypothetical protein